MRIHSLVPRSRRGRRLALAVLGALAVVGFVAVNQPRSGLDAGRGSAARLGAAAAAPERGRAADQPPSGLRVLHAHYTFSDQAALHRGAPDLPARTGILVDPDSGAILWERHPHRAEPPASTTKILSTLVALENLDPSQRITVTADAVQQEADETRLGEQAGDVYTVTELVQAMLMISANDSATTIAADTVGLTRFVRAMNEQVSALGLHDSRFVTPVGLDDPDQRASAYDLAVIGLAAYDHSALVRQVVGTTDLDVPATGGHVAYHLRNLDRLLTIYPPALGIKPGFTGDAGYCLVALARRDGHRLLAVLMDDPHLYSDTRSLLEWGFGQAGLAPLDTPTPSAPPHR